jgi:hypothetical protein
MVANMGRKTHGRSRISNGQDLLPISTAVVTSRTPSSPIRAAPITAKRRKGTSRRGYYRASAHYGEVWDFFPRIRRSAPMSCGVSFAPTRSKQTDEVF